MARSRLLLAQRQRAAYVGPVLIINNDDVRSLLSPEQCLSDLREAYVEWGHGRAAQFPPGGRMDLVAPSPGEELHRRFVWGAMTGVLPKRGVFAIRQKYDIHFLRQHDDGRQTLDKYCGHLGNYCGFITIADLATGEPVAIINDGVFQHMRVAGTAAVASELLARPDSTVLGIIGTGGMAHSHALMMAAAHGLEEIRVYSPTRANRDSFAERLTEELGMRVDAVDSSGAAVAGADIVAMCTDSHLPIFDDETWLEPGMHVTTVVPAEGGRIGEVADVVVLHVHGGVVQQVAHSEGFDEADASETFRGIYGELDASRPGLATLAEVLASGDNPRQSAEDVTYFHNQPGAGVQFAALGWRLVAGARTQGCSAEIPTSLFMQDIRN